MPDWLQVIVRVNAILHRVSAVPKLADVIAIGVDFWLTSLGAVVIAAIFAPLTLYADMR
ncbi:hypothetical protein I5U05_014210 [Stenotrophomonas maltophilia]|jgi:ABC-2 type transport system permease protein|uniref:ABC transporter domain protein n=1 Tax=Ralstonia insidiosa TaxID=190721 RepID=A0AAC9BHF7_9RALS|nr:MULTISPECIES: hypothetical protein [Pseudomonadota]MBH1608638.1 hypothetical protein [Stenotrophomonas maltophilia]MCL6470857.1 hypothetical protein [Ralstonia sp.]ANH74198.1 ABC transporter domain protein [Ralstonia insidiosa]MBH1726008.1 hypothetical protein [Stenotrophomonas maltophilia]MBH1798770.1 hypothetical protein [Stenotrophomonas maltophilia]